MVVVGAPGDIAVGPIEFAAGFSGGDVYLADVVGAIGPESAGSECDHCTDQGGNEDLYFLTMRLVAHVLLHSVDAQHCAAFFCYF